MLVRETKKRLNAVCKTSYCLHTWFNVQCLHSKPNMDKSSVSHPFYQTFILIHLSCRPPGRGHMTSFYDSCVQASHQMALTSCHTPHLCHMTLITCHTRPHIPSPHVTHPHMTPYTLTSCHTPTHDPIYPHLMSHDPNLMPHTHT